MNNQVENRVEINESLLTAMDALQNLQDIIENSQRDNGSQAGIEIGVALETISASGNIDRMISDIQNAVQATL